MRWRLKSWNSLLPGCNRYLLFSSDHFFFNLFFYFSPLSSCRFYNLPVILFVSSFLSSYFHSFILMFLTYFVLFSEYAFQQHVRKTHKIWRLKNIQITHKKEIIKIFVCICHLLRLISTDVKLMRILSVIVYKKRWGRK